MNAAFAMLDEFPPPASRARVLARDDRTSAGRAADRAVALVVERVVGNAVRVNVFPHLGFAPCRQRIEFLQAVRGVELALGELRARRGLLAALPGDPRALAGERALEWLDLAHLAAALAQIDGLVEGIPAVRTHVLFHSGTIRLKYLYFQAVMRANFFNQPQRVRMQAPGVEYENGDRQPRPRDGIGDDHVLGREAAGERLFRVLAVAQQESVEAAALQVVEVVAPDLAHRAQLALVAVALAQQPRDRKPPAVAELGEVHFDTRDALEPVRDRCRIVGRLEAQHLALFRRGRALGCDPTPFDERCHKRVP